MPVKQTTRPVTQTEWVLSILGLALFFGSGARVLPELLSGFPINDGGMFAAAMRDLIQNDFALPVFTSYNNLHIPFAYPPLGFYIGAWLQTIGISEIQVLQWVPSAFAVVSIPAFFLFAKEFLSDQPRAAAATVFFALVPGQYVWSLMGGGLTRSLGMLFFMGAVIYIRRLFLHGPQRNMAFAIVFSSLVVLSHPQFAMLTVVGAGILWMFHGRSKQGIALAILVAVGTALLTSPWWGFIASHHGLVIFLSAGQAGNIQVSLLELLESIFSIQTILPFATLFRVLGIGWLLYKRRYDLIVLGAVPFFIDQRSAPIVSGFTYPMLAAYGLMDAIPALIRALRKQPASSTENGFVYNHTLSLCLLGIIFYLALECRVHTFVIRQTVLPPAALDMGIWAMRNTPPESRFLILTNRTDLMTDPVQEWFPILAERHSATTIQGLEWTLGRDFMKRWNELSALQTCRDEGCIGFWEKQIEAEADYVILDKATTAPEIMNFFHAAPLLYENGRYLVFER